MIHKKDGGAAYMLPVQRPAFQVGDRVHTPDGVEAEVLAIDAGKVICKDARSETRWIYPRGVLPGDSPHKEE